MKTTDNGRDNLPDIAKSLVPHFEERKCQQRIVEAQAFASTIVTWNDFGDKVSSFADEHMTL